MSPALVRSADRLGTPAQEDGRILLCFSHLRWDFVYQRPQHLMSTIARTMPVIFWQEPVAAGDGEPARLDVSMPVDNVTVITPRLPQRLSPSESIVTLRALLDAYLADRPGRLIRWYYTPMMLAFSRHLDVACTIYDCMDELANFRYAPPELAMLERELFAAADLVFTGGYSLYEAKRTAHPAVYPFPSSVDAGHFARARGLVADPADQAGLGRPRFGFYGVIDERMDLALLASVADARPDWALVLVGPVVKIDPASLPRRANITYLGPKTYDELPLYAGGWDVALMPFAINESTRFISPTKTPEYLAAGLPVVSTPIIDVVRHYGTLEGVEIAGEATAFVAACERALALAASSDPAWRRKVDRALAGLSWTNVAASMMELIASHMPAPYRRPIKQAADRQFAALSSAAE